MPNDKVTIYIDGSNLYHSLNATHGRHQLDFSKFAAKLVGGRRLVRMYYYNAPVDQTKEPERYRGQQGLFSALRSVPYMELRLGRLVYRNWPNERPYEKGVDVKLATDMVVHGSQGNYDAAVLVSGDSDYADAVQAVKNFGLHVEVALLSSGASLLLREVADVAIDLTPEFLADCWR